MPLFYQQDINEDTKVGVWHITEEEPFFLRKVPAQRTIHHPHKRLQHLAGRYVLQQLFPDFPFSLIRIAETRKPFLVGDPFHFSISHAGDMAAAIVSRSMQVGVDVEFSMDRVLKITHKFLHPEEQAWLSQQEQSGRKTANGLEACRLATLLWSAKESVFKWYAEGAVDFSEHIRLDPFSLARQGVIRGRFCKHTPIPFEVAYRDLGAFYLTWIVSEGHGRFYRPAVGSRS